MSTQYDFKKEWEKTRIQLAKFNKEAFKVAKRGEKELIAFSKRSKLHIDATAISLKKEHLYYLIGKEYAKENIPTQPTAKLTKLVNELKKAEKDQGILNRKLKAKMK